MDIDIMIELPPTGYLIGNKYIIISWFYYIEVQVRSMYANKQSSIVLVTPTTTQYNISKRPQSTHFMSYRIFQAQRFHLHKERKEFLLWLEDLVEIWRLTVVALLNVFWWFIMGGSQCQVPCLGWGPQTQISIILLESSHVLCYSTFWTSIPF